MQVVRYDVGLLNPRSVSDIVSETVQWDVT